MGKATQTQVVHGEKPDGYAEELLKRTFSAEGATKRLSDELRARTIDAEVNELPPPAGPSGHAS